MRTVDFDYDLPSELIAQYPTERRDGSRLMVVDRTSEKISHAHFGDLPAFLRCPDLLVVNDSKVMRARLHGERARTGAKVEVLLLSEKEPNLWVCLARPGKRVRTGDIIRFGAGTVSAEVVEEGAQGERLLSFATAGKSVINVLNDLGELPLPPYIHQQQSDPDRYQTVYAKRLGSIAAPTAGLHFTADLLETLKEQGVGRATVTLHVGIGTFRPVKADAVSDHMMHAEYGELSEDVATAMRAARAGGGRVVAVGTTAARVLETAARIGAIEAWAGWTNIFIYPGFRFLACDALITNFHLPRSTLLMLVSAFAGKDLIDRAYAEAVRERYRFFSFGDAMLIL